MILWKMFLLAFFFIYNFFIYPYLQKKNVTIFLLSSLKDVIYFIHYCLGNIYNIILYRDINFILCENRS